MNVYYTYPDLNKIKDEIYPLIILGKPMEIPPFKDISLKNIILFILVTLVPSSGFSESLAPGRAKTLSVIAAIPTEFPPYYSLDENGNPSGFAIDILDQLALNAGIKVTYLNAGSWENVHDALSEKKADLIPNLGISQKRMQQYDFTIPVESFPISIFVRDSTIGIKDISGLSGRKVGVVKKNVAVSIINSRVDTDTLIYDNPRDALFGLLSSEVDALVYPKPVLFKIARSIGVDERIKIVGHPLVEVKRGIAVSKDRPELLARLNDSLKQFVSSPEYQTMYAKWHGAPKRFWTDYRIGWVMAAAIFISLIISAIWRYLSILSINRKLAFSLSQKEKAESALRSSESRLKTLINTLPDLIWLKDKDGVYLSCNKKFESFFGAKESDIVGKTDYDFVSRDLADFFRKNDKAAEAIGKPRTNDELVTYASDGHQEWLETIKAPLYEPNGKFVGILGIARDITERKETEEKISRQAHYDSLTDLPNRFLSLDRLDHLISEAKRNSEYIALLFIDLDNFKKINDSLGHEMGDKILIESANRLIHLVREEDTVGRFGGDEFIVLLGRLTNLDDAKSISENILKKFKERFIIDDRELSLTLSIGISMFPDDGSTPSELLRKADSAMYQSKSEGRNTHTFFTEEMNRDLNRRLHLEELLQGALERKEFTVFYQPKIDLNENAIMGAEALLRWKHPELGYIPPDEFIPLAEQIGAIKSIGEFVFHEALAATARWQREFHEEFKIAINISPKQFRDQDLFKFIEESANRHQVNYESIEIEITEGILMSADDLTNELLFKLNDIGISIAMDDFGTGYSSLSYLKTYPFNVMKIDRTFVNDITVDAGDRELVNAAIAMAHGLKLKVIAEGVETEQQLALLDEMGCDIAQGYFFSRPVPEVEFEKLFEDNTDFRVMNS